MTDRPQELRLEVKTSRAGAYSFTARDLDGPGPGGFVVALLTDRLLHAPRWVLVPVRTLRPGGYSQRDLAAAADLTALAQDLNREWSDWILDREAWQRLLEPGVGGVAERIPWCRREHPPRHNRRSGNVRENEIDAALGAFRARLDEAATGDSGSQVEGQLHQALLKDGLEQLGYTVLQNPVGVPDIVATLGGATRPTGPRARLEGWEPRTPRLREARDLLLGLEPAELRQLAEALGGDEADAPSPPREP